MSRDGSDTLYDEPGEIHSDSEGSQSEHEFDTSQTRLTDYLSVTRWRTGMAAETRSQGTSSATATDRAELRRQEAERARREHEARKKLPKITEVSWTHKDRARRRLWSRS